MKKKKAKVGNEEFYIEMFRYYQHELRNKNMAIEILIKAVDDEEIVDLLAELKEFRLEKQRKKDGIRYLR